MMKLYMLIGIMVLSIALLVGCGSGDTIQDQTDQQPTDTQSEVDTAEIESIISDQMIYDDELIDIGEMI